MRAVHFCMFTVAAALSAASPTLALNTTFAQFTQQGPDRFVTYVSTGTSNTISITDAPTNFVINAFGPLGITSTMMNMQAISTASVVNTGPQFEQVGWSGVISFTSGMVNYLTVDFSNAIANIGGQGGSGSLFATSLLGSTINYTSDVLDVSQIVPSDFSLAFSAVTPPYGIGADGYGTAFTSNIAGTFAGEVPEPMSWALLTIGFGLTGCAVRRRRMVQHTVTA